MNVKQFMFRLGVVIDVAHPVPTRAFDLVRDLGVQEIELQTWGDAGIEEISIEDIRQIQKHLLERNLHVCSVASTAFLRCHIGNQEGALDEISSFPSISGNYKDHLKALERALHIAAELSASCVRVFGFWKERDLSADVYMRAAERLVRPEQMARIAGIPLVLENHPRTYFDWSQRAARLVELINSKWIRFLWNPDHGLQSGEIDMLAAYPLLRRQVAHIHVRNLAVEPIQLEEHADLPASHEQVDWKTILRKLHVDPFSGVISVELPPGSEHGKLEADYRRLLELIRSLEAEKDI
jgi:L-ribulose-5-phosphate 3-epimerase